MHRITNETFFRWHVKIFYLFLKNICRQSVCGKDVIKHFSLLDPSITSHLILLELWKIRLLLSLFFVYKIIAVSKFTKKNICFSRTLPCLLFNLCKWFYLYLLSTPVTRRRRTITTNFFVSFICYFSYSDALRLGQNCII